ncbi:MAG: hypothetical protein A2Y24_07195 [Clostridiales bacterium GWE2_32_10]|nr:MAG: hypothetical protein A2Y24_07195 [Clostridiales bacterium GWE2_32_10]
MRFKNTFINQRYINKSEELNKENVIVGVPLCSKEFLKGVEHAPEAIRKVSMRYANSDNTAQPIKIYNPDQGYILKDVDISDFGDIKLTRNLQKSEEIIRIKMKTIFKKNCFPIIIGGDHSITFPIVSSYTGNVTVLQLDAHGDFLDEREFCPHGSVMRAVSKLNNVNKIIHCGLRGNLNTGPGLEDSVKAGNIVITASELNESGIDIISKYISEDEKVYISFDIDFLDPSIAPATNCAEPNGINYDMAIKILEKVMTNYNIIGIDFVEYNPKYDINNITGIHIVNLILAILYFKNRN